MANTPTNPEYEFSVHISFVELSLPVFKGSKSLLGRPYSTDDLISLTRPVSTGM